MSATDVSVMVTETEKPAIPERRLRIREVRQRAGIGVRELGRLIGASPSLISQIETGKSRPSVTTLHAISRALQVPIKELIELESESLSTPCAADAATTPLFLWGTSEHSQRVSIVHPSHRATSDTIQGVSWERLAATLESDAAFVEIVCAPGATTSPGGALEMHSGYVYGYVLAGVVELIIGVEVFVLNRAETVGYDASIPHTLRNPGPEVFRGVWFFSGGRTRTRPASALA